MLKHLSRAIGFAKVRDVDEFNYDQCCLIDAQGDHQEAFTSVLSACNIAKIKNCLDLGILDRILTASRDIFKARDEVIKENKVPESSRLSYRRRTILVEELNVEVTPRLLPEMIVQGARDFLGKEPTQAVTSVRALVPVPTISAFRFIKIRQFCRYHF